MASPFWIMETPRAAVGPRQALQAKLSRWIPVHCLMILLTSEQAAAAAAKECVDICEPPFAWSVTAGGGAAGTVDADIKEFLSIGGAWMLRFAFALRNTASVEVGYLGMANGIDAPGLAPRSVLLFNGIETGLRFNATHRVVFPFAVLGAGWGRYNVLSGNTASPVVRSQDDVLFFPLSFGFGVLAGHFYMDVRGTFIRFEGPDLFTIAGRKGPTNTWIVALNIGAAFS